ncbi:MAG: hypothetical protein NTU53_18880 [Planctomycetota bacterium]|nr:hypothetical protein [Planctomycetota bacterium]
MTEAESQSPVSKLARQSAERMMSDAELAAASGKAPEHLAARQRVARQFIEIHLPDKTPEQVDQILAGIDFSQPVQVVNGAEKSARAKPIWGRAPQLLESERFKPAKPEDPIYALKSYPAR